MANKTTVTFVNTSKECKKTMAGLAKSALREGGKATRKLLREKVPIRSKRFKNHIASWAYIDKTTGQPKLDIGFYSWQQAKKHHKIPSHASPHWIEFGTKSHVIKPKRARAMGYNDNFFGSFVQHTGQKATHVLRDTVYNNIDAIRAAEEKYLAELNNTLAEAGLKIVNSEEVEDD
ncbi:MAG: hypothetical protein A2Y17_12290 [Clostridiales bacterium GWF2_38_85]|nr:MAG: hypothetical protein A2Y17_12290 [Clostridiales bacterium GWF2_38_85]